MNSESGSATVWMLGMCVALVIFASAAISASALASTDTAFQGSVDRAALGAADILIGVSAGTPCLYAQELLRREGFPSPRAMLPTAVFASRRKPRGWGLRGAERLALG